MGKYKFPLDAKGDPPCAGCLAANELAENNRLLRLQIALNYGMITTKKEIKEALKDQA